jgi:hypothetical protein
VRNLVVDREKAAHSHCILAATGSIGTAIAFKRGRACFDRLKTGNSLPLLRIPFKVGDLLDGDRPPTYNSASAIWLNQYGLRSSFSKQDETNSTHSAG